MLPNFLLVGALRSGTTSLYYSLKKHPSIYFPELKEPRFFSWLAKGKGNGPRDDNIPFINSWEAYKKLYLNTGMAEAIGDASVENLFFHNKVIPHIKHYLGDTKIIIILRNPYERAISSYRYMLMKGRETLPFKRALEQEEKRMKENWLPIWFYKNNGFYYNQVKSYLNSFSKVKILIFEDLLYRPEQTLKDIHSFLLPKSNLINNTFSKSNFSGIEGFCSFYQNHLLIRKVNQWMPQKMRKYYIQTLNVVLKDKQSYNHLINKLNKCYNNDIQKLMNLINRDLDPWLK